jgi:hypothetical protein
MTSTASHAGGGNKMIPPTKSSIETSPKPKMDINPTNIQQIKKLYQEFVKTMLKVKFEKIHNTHKGQEIPEKLLFKECIKQSIPQSEWRDFIIQELKNPSKYSALLSKNKKMSKNYKANIKYIYNI